MTRSVILSGAKDLVTQSIAAKRGRKKTSLKKSITAVRVKKSRTATASIKLSLKRFESNPIISPNPENPWESKATFNTAALYEDGNIHLLYRAIGDGDRSVLGYASSDDGFRITQKLKEPAYLPKEDFEGGEVATPARASNYSSLYISGGGGWGGAEDPRLTKIGDKIYLTYVAYNGWNHPRLALTSISARDFLNHRWNWKKAVLISPPNVVDKNGCLLSEKINGKYVIFHRVYPNILIDFVRDLNFDGKTKWLKGQFKITPRKNHWDSKKIGVGAPPIKTSKGWLLIYHGVGEKDGHYKIGAMLLDVKNPAKVIARAKMPILEPEEDYERNGWKSGVVYPCGAVILKKRLLVYYGSADTYVSAASANLDKFLAELSSNKEPKLKKL